MPESTWYTIAEALVTELEGAVQNDVDASIAMAANGVVIRQRPQRLQDDRRSGVYIVPLNDTNTPITNIRDDVGYGLGIIVFNVNNRELTDSTDTLHAWVEACKVRLRRKQINSITPRVHKIDIEPRSVIDSGAFGSGFAVGSFLARCLVRQE